MDSFYYLFSGLYFILSPYTSRSFPLSFLLTDCIASYFIKKVGVTEREFPSTTRSYLHASYPSPTVSLLSFLLATRTRCAGGSDNKESACNVGYLGSIPGLGRFPWRREWQPTPVFLPGEFHGHRSGFKGLQRVRHH